MQTAKTPAVNTWKRLGLSFTGLAFLLTIIFPIFAQLLIGLPVPLAISLLFSFCVITAAGLLTLASIGILLTSAFAVLFKGTRQRALRALVVSLGLIVCIFCGMAGRFALRHRQFEDLADRSKPLIKAINLFEKDHGKPPDKLANLVPKYLNQVPNTGMGAYPDYEYQVAPELDPSDLTASWELSVPCSVGLLNWDVFYYRPSEKYPLHNYGGYIEPIKNWAYVHE